MKIKRKIQIISMLPLLLAAAVTLVLLLSYVTISKIMKKDMIATAVMKEAFELDILTTEYMINPEARPKKQWLLKYSLINDLLNTIDPEKADDKKLLEKVRREHADMKYHFLDLTYLYEEQKNSQEETLVPAGYENKLREHLLIRSHSLASDAAYMSDVSHASLMSHFKQARLLTVSSVICIVIIMVGVSVGFGRSIIEPVTKLHQATDIIAGGDLDHRVSIQTSDEIGQLSNAFDDMTLKLKGSRTILEDEIHERIHAEMSLKKEKEKLQKYLDISAVMVVMINADQEVTLINKRGCEILGYNEHQIMGKNWFDHFIPQRLRDDVKTVFNRLMAGEIKPVEYYENEVVTKKGEERLIAWYNTVFRDNSGNIIETLGSGVDITERRAVEKNIKLMALFAEFNPSPVLRFNIKGEILMANPASLKIFGRDSLTGTPLKSVLPGLGDLDLASCIKDGTILSHTTQISDRSFHFTVRGVTDLDIGQIYGDDITKLRQAEEEIRKSLEEKEILIKEIHHRVKNNMMVVSSLLKLQSANVRDEKYKEMFNDSIGRIQSMSFIHEKLYRSENLARVDFSAYLKDMVKSMFASYELSPSRVTLNMEIEDVSIGIDNAIPLGLIVNELISNSMKHAFPDNREGEVRVTLSTDNTNHITLTISDDGKGIPEGLNFTNSESLGLNLVNALTRQIQGKIELNRETGTEFRITFRRDI
jgi:PAS domain S-box-containing protein